MAREIKAWEALGVQHLAIWLGTTDPDELAIRLERFSHDVLPLID
jgi:hypothetical protein